MTLAIRKDYFRSCIYFAFISAFITVGCSANDAYLKSSGDNLNPGSRYIQGVPFFPQDAFQCGPSVLASVLSFYDYELSPDDISSAIYSKNLKGTLTSDMAAAARRYAVEAMISVSEVKGDLDLIRQDIANGHPLIVFVDLGFWNIRKGHYMLVVGYDDLRKELRVYSGRDKDKSISYNRFMKIWKRGGYWALRIERK